jgi:hypothetical protein
MPPPALVPAITSTVTRTLSISQATPLSHTATLTRGSLRAPACDRGSPLARLGCLQPVVSGHFAAVLSQIVAALAPKMVARGSGSIINVASMAG